MDKPIFIIFDDDKELRDVFQDHEDRLQISEAYDILFIRTFRAFMDWITSNPLPKRISFDYQLGNPPFVQMHYDQYELYSLKELSDYSLLTGLEVVRWFIDYCEANNLKFPDYNCHSWNSFGKMRIFELIKSRINN